MTKAEGSVEDGEKVQHVNNGGEEALEFHGYKKNSAKNALIISLYVCTLGLLRLFFHWFPRYRLLATHDKCSLGVAEKILIVDSYKNRYKTYFVETVNTLSALDVKTLKGEVNKLTYYLEEPKLKEAVAIRTFFCKRHKYIWEDRNRTFVKLSGLQNGIPQSDLHTARGLSEHSQILRRTVYGPNDIDVPLDSTFKLFLLEALTPFYIFQVFSLIVWMCEEYYYYGIVIIFLSVVGIGSSVLQTRKNQTNLRGTIHMSDFVTVVRSGGKIERVVSSSLVPGDVIEVPGRGGIMHCDAVLLNGNCIVDESMLTGESVPVTKTALPNSNKFLNLKDSNNHVLYCGTKVIQTKETGDTKVLAIVTNTGFLTTKGELVRSILYPPPADFKFDQDSYKFIIILSVIALIGFIYTIVSKSSRHIAVGDMMIKALDTITIVIPPALPAAMTVGKLYALIRLKRHDIFCINSRVINVTGSVNCVCFDKTGTLTEDGLDIWGVVPVNETNRLSSPVTDVDSFGLSSNLLRAMATCHSLTLIDEKPDGDPLDVKMFEATKWSLEEPSSSDIHKFGMAAPRVVKPPQQNDQTPIEIGIIHQHQFSSNLQRMSVITKSNNTGGYELYCKGSPEMIASLSRPMSVPENINDIIREYTSKGYRVIAAGYRTLDAKVQVLKEDREEMEHDLIFLGLIVLENKLKSPTTDIIHELRVAKIRVVMITGDNKLTALSVANECCIIDHDMTVLDVDARAPTKTEDAKLIFTTLQKNEKKIRKMLTSFSEVEIEMGAQSEHIVFIMTGDTWKLVQEYFPLEVPKFVARGIVFARMASYQKQELVEELKGLGYYVAMCGDGSNDCSALKAAHVGISLSQADSSIASPFTSRNPDITCVPEVIKQGRAALVTSFGIFKFMLIYSLAEYTSAIILYSIDNNLTTMQYLFIDLCVVTVCASVFGKTQAYSKELHSRPPMASLLGLIPLASMTLHILCIITFQVLAYNIIQTFDWFEPFKHIPNVNYFISYENYAVFAVSLFQYITTATVFSKGPPYRQPLYTNKIFSFILIALTGLSIYIILEPAIWIKNILELKTPPNYDGKLMMLLLGACNFLLAYILEDFVVDFLLYKKVKPRFHNIDRSRRKYLKIEREIDLDSRWRISGAPVGGYDNIGFVNEGRCDIFASENL